MLAGGHKQVWKFDLLSIVAIYLKSQIVGKTRPSLGEGRLVMYTKILVCLDGSRLAEQILPYVIKLVEQLRSKVILFQVVPPPLSVGRTELERVSEAEIIDRMQKEIYTEETEAKLYLVQIARQLMEKQLEVEQVVLQGIPGESIVSYAKENEVGLIAISTHGRGGLGRLIFGSVADFVLKKSGLPILLIKSK